MNDDIEREIQKFQEKRLKEALFRQESDKLAQERQQVRSLDLTRAFYEMISGLSAIELEAFDQTLKVISASSSPVTTIQWLRGWLSAMLYSQHNVPPWGEMVDEHEIADLLKKEEA